MIHLRLNIVPLILLHRSDIDFRIEVTNIADDGLVLHLQHMVMGDDTQISGRGDKDISLVTCLVHGDNTITLHRCL